MINIEGGGRNIRVMRIWFQSNSNSTGFAVGMGTAFASAAVFPHYAIQQGIPYNIYGSMLDGLVKDYCKALFWRVWVIFGSIAQCINHFRINDSWYASASKDLRTNWAKFTKDYFLNRHDYGSNRVNNLL